MEDRQQEDAAGVMWGTQENIQASFGGQAKDPDAPVDGGQRKCSRLEGESSQVRRNSSRQPVEHHTQYLCKSFVARNLILLSNYVLSLTDLLVSKFLAISILLGDKRCYY